MFADVKKVEVESEDKIPLWRTLMPVIKFNISSGRLTFGNRLMPTTLGKFYRFLWNRHRLRLFPIP